MSEVKKMFINGELIAAQGDKTYDLFNPSTGECIAKIADGGQRETALAIDAAAKAFPAWSKKTMKARGALLRRAEQLMLEKQDQIAELLSKENGKPFLEAKQEVVFASGYLNWYAEVGRHVNGEWVPSPFENKRLLVTHKPVGVVAASTPWNFPANMITRKIAPALAAGCTVVLKPADLTPLTALALADIFNEAGIPKGVFNIVTAKDPAPVSDEMLSNEKVKLMTFTGSVPVGKMLYERSAAQLKRISLELGGNAPVLVFDDVDLEEAVKQVIAIKYLRVGGESCICANRIYIQKAIYADFVKLFTEKVKQLKVGDAFTADVKIGPMISEAALSRVTETVQKAIADGAKLNCGGQALTDAPYNKGHFYAPTVLSDVQDNFDIAQHEIFGPVASLFVFDDEDKVVTRANAVEYGLAAYVFTRDYARIIRVTEALEYGFIGVNDGDGYTHEIPVGGFKDSGIGREGGVEGLLEYMEAQSVLMRI